ncbi:MAG: autotransporter outer membrane beta-barrel domain-containing protein [Myxococcales bacterium]|nr:autotransporter domain-containing protein [Myxococcales bacterium]HIK84677.1 autotransporter domain-containing protein [Myxococcales bacterium]
MTPISRAAFLLFTTLLAVTWYTESAQADCNPASPVDDDNVVCDDVTDSTGFDGSTATGLTITTSGTAVLDESGALDSAILASDDNDITIGVDATITVTEANGFGINAGDNNMITNQGTINLNMIDGATAINVGDGNTVVNEGTITIAGDNGTGIRGNDANGMGSLTSPILNNEGIIMITGADGVGIRGNNDNFVNVEASGTIVLDGARGRGIQIGDNTTGVLPAGAVNRGTITVNTDNSFAIESGDNAGVATLGTIDLIGDFTRGISAGSRTDPLLAADISNSGTLNVGGADSIGISVGDDWIRGGIVGEAGPNARGVANFAMGQIDVTGDRSVGIFAGDLSNAANTNNSFVLNEGIINVGIDGMGTSVGVDAIGISVGGNDLFTSFDFLTAEFPDGANVLNRGMIIGGRDAMPLIVIREFVAGSENRVFNAADAAIRADLTDRVFADRGVAIRGTTGVELIDNSGDIRGDIELLAGDDRYVHRQGATLTNPDDGPSVFGGPGNDVAVLFDNSVAAEIFDLRHLDGFETVEVGGGSFGWDLVNGAGFAGAVEIVDNGRLRLVTPLTLGGDFSANPTGTVELTLAATPTLTVMGASVFDGTLSITVDPSLPGGAPPLLAISALGGFTGQFDFVPPVQGLRVLEATYAPAGLFIQLVSDDAVGVASGSIPRAIAKHLDDIKAVGSPSPDLQNLLDDFDTASGNLNNVFRALSPEIYDAQTQAIVDGGRRVTNLLFNRPRECAIGERVSWQKADAQLPCHAHTWSAWLAGVGGIRSREKFGDHAKYNAQLGGLVFGVDLRPMDDLDLTIAISSQRGTVSGDNRGSSTITLTDLMGQFAWNRGPLRVQGALGWGHGFHQDRRRIRFSEEGLTDTNVRGLDDHDSDRISLGAEVGYIFDAGDFKVEPIGGLDWAWVYQRPIHEVETSGFGIRIDSRDDAVGSLNAGVRASTSYLHSRYLGQWFLWMDGVWQPSIDVRWRQVVTGWDRKIDARLQGAPSGVSDFTIKGREDRGGAEIAAAVSFTPKDANRLQFDLRYESFVSSHTVSQDLTASVQISF